MDVAQSLQLASAVVAIVAILAALFNNWQNLTMQREIADANRVAQGELQATTLREQERMATEAREAQRALQEHTLEQQRLMAQEARDGQLRLEKLKQRLVRRERHADALLVPLRRKMYRYEVIISTHGKGDNLVAQQRLREAITASDHDLDSETSVSAMMDPALLLPYHEVMTRDREFRTWMRQALKATPVPDDFVDTAMEALYPTLEALKAFEDAAERYIFAD